MTKKLITTATNMDIKYAYTILYVENVSTTMTFYKDVFGFQQKLLTPENDYGELLSGETTIAFANLELGKANFKKGFVTSNLEQQPFGFELAFTTSEVDLLIEKAVLHGAVQLSETTVKPWGQKVGYVRDLNGFIIEICSPMKS